jgi:hypothetical protein
VQDGQIGESQRGEEEEEGDDGERDGAQWCRFQLLKAEQLLPHGTQAAPANNTASSRKSTLKYDDSGRGDIIARNKQSRNPGRINQ